ncbi:MAG: DEAD/DEAH box helicase family protein, partial [Spirochaetia bacterium]|nr:DEAD/DEAH box helicase family protein [Spirochaetia bacterium]
MGKFDQYISDKPSFDAFFKAVSDFSDQKLKGDVFERLTQIYLETMPEYRAQFRSVWIHTQVPPKVRERIRLPVKDEGIDLIAETHEGNYWAIQSKFRSDQDGALTRKSLSTFSSLVWSHCKHIEKSLVIHTSAKPIGKISLMGNMVEIGLERWLALSEEDWLHIQDASKGKEIIYSKREPRPHQTQAISLAEKHFKTDMESRGRLTMPCGTGKSLTAFWIAEALDP